MNHKNKNINFIFTIIIFFFIIPIFLFFFIKDYSYVSLKCAGIKIINLNYKTIFSILSVFVGVFSIIKQTNKEKRINEARFVLDLNNSFSKNTQISDFFYKIQLDLENLESIDKFLKYKKNKTTVIEYIVFFETINILLSRKILKISEINDLFSGRFFAFVNNPKIQKYTILKNNKYIKNIYQLYSKLFSYRLKNKLPIPYSKFSLHKIDKDYEYISSFGFFESLNLKTIIFFFFFIILLIIFILNKILNFTNYCHDIKIETSFLIGSISGFIGIISVLNQTIKEKRIVEGKFIMDLNNHFLMNTKIDKMLILLEQEEDGIEYKVIKNDDIPGIMEYIIFFETVYSSIKEKAISIEEVDKLFAKRFFMFVNNKTIQKEKIIKNSIYLKNIYRLYDVWIKYRLKYNLDIPYCKNALNEKDKNYKNNLK